MSLRLRIALAAAVALAFVAAISGVTIYSVIASELRGETAASLRGIARSAPLPGDGGFPEPIDMHDRRRPHGGEPGRFGGAAGYRQLLRRDGGVERDSGDEDALPVTEEDRRIATSGSGEVIHDHVTVDGIDLMVLTMGRGSAGAIQVARPVGEIEQVLARAATVLALISGFGIAAALVLGLLIARVALRPVSRFTQEAEDIAADPTSGGRLDVTGSDEVSRLATSFNRTLDSLERSMRAQQQLIADAGHELRTPIASIRANIQVLDEADRLDPEDVVALRRDIVEELDELTELLGDVIELARSADPDAPEDDVRLDLVVRAAADRAARRGDSTVRMQLDLEPSVVRGDPARIARAVANIVDNARKWSPARGVVDIGLEGGVVRVRDHGPGFPEDSLDRVFDRFWRAPDARAMPGSGLGLAIVQQTAHDHGGWVRVANADDGGAVVLVSFGASMPPAC